MLPLATALLLLEALSEAFFPFVCFLAIAAADAAEEEEADAAGADAM